MDERRDEIAPVGDELDLLREIASGSGCSLRVLGLINTIHTHKRVDEKTVQSYFGDDSYEHIKCNSLAPLGDGELVRLPDGTDESITIGYLETSTNKALPLWRLVEKPADEAAPYMPCSYAVFLPAFDETHGIDYSLVVTTEDEARTSSPEATIQDIPQTNARVLDELKECITNPGKPNELANMIKVDELIKSYELDIPFKKPLQYESFDAQYTSPLHRKLGGLAVFAQLSGEPIKLRGAFSDEVNAHIEIAPDGAAKIAAHVLNLGRDGRITPAGTLHIGSELIALPEGAVNENMLYKLAEKSVHIPEVLSDETLKQKVQEIVNSADSLGRMSHRIRTLVDDKLQELEEMGEYTQVIDLGTLDMSGAVPQPTNGSMGYRNEDDQFLSDMARVKVDVIANDSFDVLMNSNAYGSTVRGARYAFSNTRNFRAFTYRMCTAIDVEEAFEMVSLAEDCLVINANRAFQSASTTGCIAENVRVAFSSKNKLDRYNRNTAIGSIAKNCYQAFSNIEASNSVAEHCRYAFTGSKTKDCESRNPKLFGWNFRLTQTNRRTGSKITGRVVGIDGAKARGKYRSRREKSKTA